MRVWESPAKAITGWWCECVLHQRCRYIHSLQAGKTPDSNLSGRNTRNAGELESKAGWIWLHMHMQGVHPSVHIQISVTEYHI